MFGDSMGIGFGGTILLVTRLVVITVIIGLIWGDIGLPMTVERAGNGIIAPSSIDTFANPKRRRVFGDSISQCYVARTLGLVINEVAMSQKSTATKTPVVWKALHPGKFGHFYGHFS